MSAAEFTDRVALVAGGAAGIGEAIVRRLRAGGAQVVIGDVQHLRGEALAAELGDSACFTPLDVRRPAEWRSAFDCARRSFARPTILVNVAGIVRQASIEQETLEGFRDLMAINLEGMFLGCQLAVEEMRDARAAAIVNISSILGVRSGAAFPAYSSSKAAVRALTRSVALACAERGYDIRVNAVLPGAIHTDMVDRVVEQAVKAGGSQADVLAGLARSSAFKRLGRPAEVAEAVAFLASERASFITGADLVVDGGALA